MPGEHHQNRDTGISPSGRIKNLAINLIAPGLGQFGARRWARGSIMLLTGIGCTLWFTWEVVHPMYLNIANVLNDMKTDFSLFNWANMGISLGTLALTWVLSYADLLLFRGRDGKNN